MPFKLKPEQLFGALSVSVAVVALYFELKKGNSGGGTTIIPSLTSPTESVPSTTSSGVPAYTAAPYQYPPNVIQMTQAPAQEVPYQTRNFGPRHVHRKAVQQQQRGAWKPNAPVSTASTEGCSCNDKCSSSGQFVPSQGVSIPSQTLANMVQNLQTVQSTPQPSYGNTPNHILNSTIQQYNLQVAGQTQVASLYGNTNQPPVLNVPSITAA